MTPLQYFTGHVWIHKQNGENVEYEDKRTGDSFDSREEVNNHCRKMAENFETEVEKLE